MTPFIIRQDRGSYYGGIEYLLADDIRISYSWNHRVKKSRHVEGLGTINEIEHTTRRKSHVEVFLPDAVSAAGLKISTSWNRVTVKLLDLKKHMRRLKDADADQIAALDKEIGDLQKQIEAKRAERRTRVTFAWRRAEPVPSIEIVDAADAHAAEHP